MNKKQECEIVRDLAILYVEDIINEGSRKFIEQHLETCNECKEYYKKIKLEINNSNIKENNNDNIIVNQFKKFNRHFNILKMSIITILIIIIILFSVLFIRYQKVNYIINKSYNEIEHIRELKNYKLVIKTIKNDYYKNTQWEYIMNCYYKNGKYKVESDNSIFFYEDDSYKKTMVYHDLKQIDEYSQDYIEVSKGKRFNNFTQILNYKEIIDKNVIYSLAWSIREDNYNGIECYVIRNGNKNNYRDVWINKKNFITIRVFEKNDKNSYDIIYNIYEDVVSDKDIDIKVLDSDKYKEYTKNYINNNSSKDTRLFLDIYND